MSFLLLLPLVSAAAPPPPFCSIVYRAAAANSAHYPVEISPVERVPLTPEVLAMMDMKRWERVSAAQSVDAVFVAPGREGQIPERELSRMRRDFQLLGNAFSSRMDLAGYERKFAEGNFRPETLKGKTVADLGVGMGSTVEELTKLGANAVGVDWVFHPLYRKHSQVMVEAKALNLDFSRRVGASLSHLPFADQSLDCVVSRHALMHLSPGVRAEAAREIGRTLKEKGAAFLDEMHRDMEDVFRSQGFEVKQCGPECYVVSRAR